MATIRIRVKQRLATLAEMTAENRTLEKGEVWIEQNASTGNSTGRRKVGTGLAAFNDLPFEPGGTDLSITNRGATTLDLGSATGADVTLPAATNTEAGLATAAQITKLEEIAAGATANATDAQLRDRQTHTGEQAISTITGLSTSLAAKADLVGGVIPTSQIPSVALVEFLGAVASQAAMLALRGQPGDWAIRTDRATEWVIVANNGATLSDWYELPTGIAPVGSVNGQTGSVVLATGDLEETGGKLYFTNARAIGAELTGFVSGAGTVAATDTILQAIQKLVGNLAGRALTGAIGSSGLTMATARILGRSTAGTGAPEEIALGAGFSLVDGTLTATGGGLAAIHKDASEFIPSTTAGCGIDSQQTSVNQVNRDMLLFDPGIQEHATTWFIWPSGWNTAQVSFYWFATTGTGSAVFGAQMTTFTDGDIINLAWGTAQEVTDAAAIANSHRQTAPTAGITPAGTVSAGKLTALRIYRNAGSVSDNLSIDSAVVGVLLEKAS